MTPSPESAALVAELERARALRTNPSASQVWLHAPPRLRLMFADGLIDEQTFWDAFARWLRSVA